jgi:ATP adenylyltransferase
VDRLWTPWRRAFVEGAADTRSYNDECFLCAAPAQHDDTANLIVMRSKSVFVLLNLYPYNTGHLLIVPYIHEGDLARLDPDIASEMMAITQRSVDVVHQVYKPDGFNVGMNLGKSAGAGVPDHLHIHLVPRWNGDTNFMPIVADTKVLPESLSETYARLQPVFRRV